MQINRQVSGYFPVLSVLVLSALIAGCEGDTRVARMARDAREGGRVIFEAIDDMGDDAGPGSYVYPDNIQFRPGCMDLLRFTVLDAGRFVNLVFEFREDIIHGRPHEGGWSVHLIDVYVDTIGEKGAGHTRTLPGRNVEFGDYGWEKVVLIAPIRKERLEVLIERKTEILWLEEFRRRGDIVIPESVLVGPRTLVARVLKTELGEPEPHWGWQPLVMGFDPFDSTPYGFYNMEVRANPSEGSFGGGSDYRGNPNVIDMLDFEGGTQLQALSRWRSHPDPDQNELARICFARNR